MRLRKNISGFYEKERAKEVNKLLIRHEDAKEALVIKELSYNNEEEKEKERKRKKESK